MWKVIPHTKQTSAHTCTEVFCHTNDGHYSLALKGRGELDGRDLPSMCGDPKAVKKNMPQTN